MESVLFHRTGLDHTGRNMDLLNPQLALLLLGAAVLGGLLAWVLLAQMHRRQLEARTDDWQDRIDNLARTRDRLLNEADSLRASAESQQAIVIGHEHAVATAGVEIESRKEKERQLRKFKPSFSSLASSTRTS